MSLGVAGFIGVVIGGLVILILPGSGWFYRSCDWWIGDTDTAYSVCYMHLQEVGFM